jgi:hypothetical protein
LVVLGKEGIFLKGRRVKRGNKGFEKGEMKEKGTG